MVIPSPHREINFGSIAPVCKRTINGIEKIVRGCVVSRLYIVP